eukprot:TRINITY_DN66079_c7_g9_i3.p1 TRINITY_DN66079_c7_g9~~TRINITY_DN66079_c7_g9_i3.p1  ORF type:complete len:1148 (+),score=204.41 TRINITY_DN66079_c7_g9_i3:23-3445(+)
MIVWCLFGLLFAFAHGGGVHDKDFQHMQPQQLACDTAKLASAAGCTTPNCDCINSLYTAIRNDFTLTTCTTTVLCSSNFAGRLAGQNCLPSGLLATCCNDLNELSCGTALSSQCQWNFLSGSCTVKNGQVVDPPTPSPDPVDPEPTPPTDDLVSQLGQLVTTQATVTERVLEANTIAITAVDADVVITGVLFFLVDTSKEIQAKRGQCSKQTSNPLTTVTAWAPQAMKDERTSGNLVGTTQGGFFAPAVAHLLAVNGAESAKHHVQQVTDVEVRTGAGLVIQLNPDKGVHYALCGGTVLYKTLSEKAVKFNIHIPSKNGKNWDNRGSIGSFKTNYEAPEAPTEECPPASSGTGFCVELCVPGDPTSCAAGLMCCSNGCGHTCQTPVKIGTPPKTDDDDSDPPPPTPPKDDDSNPPNEDDDSDPPKEDDDGPEPDDDDSNPPSDAKKKVFHLPDGILANGLAFRATRVLTLESLSMSVSSTEDCASPTKVTEFQAWRLARPSQSWTEKLNFEMDGDDFMDKPLFGKVPVPEEEGEETVDTPTMKFKPQQRAPPQAFAVTFAPRDVYVCSGSLTFSGEKAKVKDIVLYTRSTAKPAGEYWGASWRLFVERVVEDLVYIPLPHAPAAGVMVANTLMDDDQGFDIQVRQIVIKTKNDQGECVDLTKFVPFMATKQTDRLPTNKNTAGVAVEADGSLKDAGIILQPSKPLKLSKGKTKNKESTDDTAAAAHKQVEMTMQQSKKDKGAVVSNGGMAIVFGKGKRLANDMEICGGHIAIKRPAELANGGSLPLEFFLQNRRGNKSGKFWGDWRHVHGAMCKEGTFDDVLFCEEILPETTSISIGTFEATDLVLGFDKSVTVLNVVVTSPSFGSVCELGTKVDTDYVMWPFTSLTTKPKKRNILATSSGGGGQLETPLELPSMKEGIEYQLGPPEKKKKNKNNNNDVTTEEEEGDLTNPETDTAVAKIEVQAKKSPNGLLGFRFDNKQARTICGLTITLDGKSKASAICHGQGFPDSPTAQYVVENTKLQLFSCAGGQGTMGTEKAVVGKRQMVIQEQEVDDHDELLLEDFQQRIPLSQAAAGRRTQGWLLMVVNAGIVGVVVAVVVLVAILIKGKWNTNNKPTTEHNNEQGRNQLVEEDPEMQIVDC